MRGAFWASPIPYDTERCKGLLSWVHDCSTMRCPLPSVMQTAPDWILTYKPVRSSACSAPTHSWQSPIYSRMRARKCGIMASLLSPLRRGVGHQSHRAALSTTWEFLCEHPNQQSAPKTRHSGRILCGIVLPEGHQFRVPSQTRCRRADLRIARL